MTSLQTRAAQTDRGQGYFINVASLAGQVYAYSGTATTGLAGTFSCATFAYINGGTGLVVSSLNTAGGCILKDMGRTVVSSSRTFRKVQVVKGGSNGAGVNGAASTFGVTGQAGTTPGQDYLTGFIELGFDGVGTPAPVAAFGR